MRERPESSGGYGVLFRGVELACGQGTRKRNDEEVNELSLKGGSDGVGAGKSETIAR
jgi:hypothetical protein